MEGELPPSLLSLSPDRARPVPAPPPLQPTTPNPSESGEKKKKDGDDEGVRQRVKTATRMNHQQPHSHPHHQPSRHILQSRKPVVAAAPTDVINPRILDASLRDVTERLTAEQKAEVLIHAMNLLKLAKYVSPSLSLSDCCSFIASSPFSHHIVENGVMSCLQAANLGTPQRVQALLLRGRARMAAGELSKARQGLFFPLSLSTFVFQRRADLYQVLEIVPEHAVAKSLLSIPILNDGPSHTRDVSLLFSPPFLQTQTVLSHLSTLRKHRLPR